MYGISKLDLMLQTNIINPRDKEFLERCQELAALAPQTGDAAVGSLVVLNNEVIGEGVESVKANNDITAHAEIVALRHAAASLGTRNLNGATLYTSVAPCIMCAYAIRLANITRVVSATPEPNCENRIHGFTILSNPGAVPNRPAPELAGYFCN